MGEDRNLVINPEQAKTVRRIYAMFLEGKSPHVISKILTDEPETLTVIGKQKWNPTTIKSILTNEKYKGDALLQKSYTVDFLTKEKKVNEGEIPQYYVKGNHEAIIQPEVFDMVQNMMAMRKTGKNRISSINAFSSKIRCGDCGGWYGSKVWHSNTKYRRRVWRCNYKYENDDKCQTPHLTDDEVKEIFVNSTNQLIEIKEEVIRNFEEARELLFGTAELEQEQEELEDTLNQLADEINALINENARIALDQAKYERNYSKLLKKFDEAEARLATVKAKIALRQGQQEQVEMFLKELENTDLVDEFDESLFNRLVEVIDIEKEKITVTFKDGSEVII